MANLRARVIQYMMHRGCVTSEEMFALLSSLRESQQSQLTEENAARSIANLNQKLQMFNMMIRSTYDPNTRQRYYSLISTVDNDIMKHASHYTEKEFEYFRLIWLELQTNSPVDKKRLHQVGKNLKLPNNKALVTEWVAKKWLHMSPDDEVSLGPRANAELDVLLGTSSAAETSQNEASTSS